MRGRLRPCLIVSVVALIVAGWPASVADVATRVLAPEHLPPSSHAAAPAVEGTLSVDSLPSALRRAVLNAPYEVMPVEGGFSVATAAYRADFSDEGVTFAAAGTNDLEPGVWRYRLEAVERGVVRSALAPVTPVAESNSVEFRRPGVLERYVADGRGIEQVFVLDEPPGGSGDVDLVGQVDAGAASLPGDGQVVYRAPAAAAITYGRPFAFDAGGRPIPVETIVQGSTLRLRLDGAALAGAAFPVTIDPVIWGAVELYNATDSHRPAVAFNPRLHRCTTT